MKRLTASAVLLFLLVLCHAQWSTRGTVELSMGGSFPMGEFAYARFDYDPSGYAEAGIAMAASLKYRVNSHLGLVASLSQYFLGVDEENVGLQYWPQVGHNSTVEATPWLINPIMGGIDIILPIYQSDFNLRLLGGLARTRLPGLTIAASGFEREATTDIAGAWSAGAGYTYQYFEKVTLSLRLDFLMTRPILDDIWSSNIASGSGEITQNVTIVNLTAGIGFRIF